MDELFLCVYHAHDQKTGVIVASYEYVLPREEIVSGRTIDAHKERILTQHRHGGPAVTVVVHSLTNLG